VTSSPSRNRLDYGRFGRRFVFYVTLIVYLTGVLLSAFAWDLWSKSTGRDLLPAHDNLEVHPGKVFGVGLILTSMLGRYRQRSILAAIFLASSLVMSLAAARLPGSDSK
jgi:MFS family permease